MINAKMKIVATRLQDGQDLMKEIQKLAEDHSIQAGVVLSAVGSLKTSNIRVPILNGKIKYIYPKNLEIDNLHGTVSINGNGRASERKLYNPNHMRASCRSY
jgi:predicted DNA-binding protein with PD1-like motif